MKAVEEVSYSVLDDNTLVAQQPQTRVSHDKALKRFIHCFTGVIDQLFRSHFVSQSTLQ